MPSDGKSSPCLRQGELKICQLKNLIFSCISYIFVYDKLLRILSLEQVAPVISLRIKKLTCLPQC